MRVVRFLSSILLIGLLALGAGLPLGAAAQDEGGSPQLSLIDVDNAAFPRLTLTLSVVDTNGQPVRGLTPGAFTVTEDGKPAEVTAVNDVADQKVGIGVVLVIDVSGSMAGAPIAAAREAAISFINGLGPNDVVAILAFDRTVRNLLPFSDNKADATTIIRNLSQTPGGATALYDAAKEGVRTAATSTRPRRMVILLSDGREYISNGQPTSLSGRDEAYKSAEAKGVTVHTIGLGNQIDEAYLRQLAGLTGGAYLAAPTPAQLKAQWEAIAKLMRQLVQVQVQSRARGENQSHDLTVSVMVGKQTAQSKGIFFSKAVAPVVSLPGLPATPLNAPTTLTARVEPVEVARVTFSVDGRPLSAAENAPWQASLDPLKLLPGAHTLTVEATDASGLTGTVEAKFEVAALPPSVKLAVSEGQLLQQPLSVTPEIQVQGQIKSVTLDLDGQAQPLAEPPYRFVLDPVKLKGGAHKVTLTVTDSQGQTTTTEVAFTVPNAPAAAPASGGAGPATVVTPAVATGGFSPALLGVIGFAIVVLAGMVGFVLLRREGARARSREVRGPALKAVSGLEKGQVFAITSAPQVIGRLSSAPIHLSDPTGALRISREHARVWLEGGAAWIEDTGSRHGTFADGHKLVARYRLASGTKLKIGEVEMVAEGITASAEDLRATSFTPLTKAAADDASSRETQVSDSGEERETRLKAAEPAATSAEAQPGEEAIRASAPVSEEERQTRLKPPEDAAASAEEATRPSRAVPEEERQTRLKPAESAPSPEAQDEAARATLLVDPSERQTRLKPPPPLPEAGSDDEAGRATVLVDPSERQTRLKPPPPLPEAEPEAPTLDDAIDANRVTRLAKPRPAGERPEAGEEPRETKAKKG